MNAPVILEKYEIYRVVTDYEGLQDAFIDRDEDLDVTREQIDINGNMLKGYSQKVLAVPPVKTLGKVSLGKMLKATGLALIVVIDDERFAPLKDQMSKRQRPMRAMASIVKPRWLFSAETGSKMAKRRSEVLSSARKSKIAKRAARARWRKERERAKEQP